MENKINIAELLKGAPIGTRLYSPIFGELTYIGSSDQEGMTYSVINCQYPDRVEKGDNFYFDENGRYLTNYYYPPKDGECMLFPSKNCRTWENFEPWWDHQKFQPYEKVIVKYGSLDNIWVAGLYSHYDAEIKKHYTIGGCVFNDNEILPYDLNEDMLGQNPLNNIRCI